jgi:hypothetical protein
MKPSILLPLVLAALIGGVHPLPAETPAMEKRLARGLKLYPEADADKDGKLSLEEALAFLEKHPELKLLLGEKLGDPGSPSSPTPAAPAPVATPASSSLPAGPRLFVCAHSFMIYTAKLLPPLAEMAGIAHQSAGQQMIGGSRVIQHWNLTDDKNKAKAALREGKVDVLTLSPHLLLPDEGIDNFTKLGLEKNPNLRVLVQASWPARDGVEDKEFVNEKRNESTLDSLGRMHQSYHATWLSALETQVRALNQAIGHETVFIVPVAEAVIALRNRIAEGKAPGLTKQTDLFRDNLGHPMPPLAALVTYCHFAAIYQKSPMGLPVPAELKTAPQAEDLNRLLQQLAWDAVTSYPMSGVKAASATTAAKP